MQGTRWIGCQYITALTQTNSHKQANYWHNQPKCCTVEGGQGTGRGSGRHREHVNSTEAPTQFKIKPRNLLVCGIVTATNGCSESIIYWGLMNKLFQRRDLKWDAGNRFTQIVTQYES